ncbi:hypothetical protein LCGC14_1802810 [marine sediment metagenome]|uniref:Zinc finger CHC2-type domain-containing protein n=1 Tax=marine sediment metagenome TaxID=412755 RepID=A0A0F9HBW3_9ZZZZ
MSDIVDVIGRNVTLVPAGRLFKGDCPFCGGHNVFFVSREQGSWHCFGECAIGGTGDDFRNRMNAHHS